MKRAILATPVYSGVHHDFAAMREHTIYTLAGQGWQVIPRAYACSSTCHGRNGLASDFLYNTDADVILWVDSDEAWSPGDAASLLDATEKLPFVAGAVRMKYRSLSELPWREIAEAAIHGMRPEQLQFVGQEMAFAFRPEDIDARRGYIGEVKAHWGRRLVRVERAGTGFFAMRRRELLAVANDCPEVEGGMRILFNNVVEGDHLHKLRFVGEDTAFCSLLRELGYEIWLDADTKIEHFGSMGVVGDLTGEWLHDLARKQASSA